jgi:hypothetical protein
MSTYRNENDWASGMSTFIWLRMIMVMMGNNVARRSVRPRGISTPLPMVVMM